MATKHVKLVSLAAALAALPGAAVLTAPPAEAKPAVPVPGDAIGNRASQPNVFMAVGKDLLGMVVKQSADGIVTADHYSHSSHASHASHSSHYSGR